MRQNKNHFIEHDEAYWDKLRKQFLSSNHERKGAYSDKDNPKPARNFLEYGGES